MADLGSTSSAIGAWSASVADPGARRREPTPLIGVLPGEGIGPAVVEAALEVLRRLRDVGGPDVRVEIGGEIGRDAERSLGTPLPDHVVAFCERIFERGGAILNGPGGSRYVYELRHRLDLFCKLVPIEARNANPVASPLRPEVTANINMLIVRENIGGVYQGSSAEHRDDGRGRVVSHSFSYVEADVRRFLAAASRLAQARRGELTVVTKEAGVPGISGLWRECAYREAAAHGVECRMVDVDLMAYWLVRRPSEFDVVAAPNMCGDILGDLAAALVGSRGMSFSGNFTPRGHGVFQTNHGAAYDVAGTDRANPVGQILSLAMLLRESLGLEREASAIEAGVRTVWGLGHRPADVREDGEAVAVGTREMAGLVADAAAGHLATAEAA